MMCKYAVVLQAVCTYKRRLIGLLAHSWDCEIKTVVALEFQINVRVQINVRAGKFAKNSKHTGPNRYTDWKI